MSIYVTENDPQTGEIVEREFTPAELKAYHEYAAKVTAERQAAADKAVADAAAREAAIAHAKSLGFTDEMIAVMYPNLANEPSRSYVKPPF